MSDPIDYEVLCEMGRIEMDKLDKSQWRLGELASKVSRKHTADFARQLNAGKRSVQSWRQVWLFWPENERRRASQVLRWTHFREAMLEGKELDKARVILEQIEDKLLTPDQLTAQRTKTIQLLDSEATIRGVNPRLVAFALTEDADIEALENARRNGTKVTIKVLAAIEPEETQEQAVLEEIEGVTP